MHIVLDCLFTGGNVLVTRRILKYQHAITIHKNIYLLYLLILSSKYTQWQTLWISLDQFWLDSVLNDQRWEAISCVIYITQIVTYWEKTRAIGLVRNQCFFFFFSFLFFFLNNLIEPVLTGTFISYPYNLNCHFHSFAKSNAVRMVKTQHLLYFFRFVSS